MYVFYCSCMSIYPKLFKYQTLFMPLLWLFSLKIRFTTFSGLIVEIACLYTSCCLPSLSNTTVKLSNPFTEPFNWKPLVRYIVTAICSFLTWFKKTSWRLITDLFNNSPPLQTCFLLLHKTHFLLYRKYFNLAMLIFTFKCLLIFFSLFHLRLIY